MRCSHCGHINPYENNFCGICGAVLSTRWQATDATSRASRITLEDSNTATHVARMTMPGQPREPESIAVAPPERDASHGVKADGDGAYPESGRNDTLSHVEEPLRASLSVGGPSFLGLNEPADSSDYSYLMEDEHPSHAGVWVLLVLLAILGGLTYWKWEPIRGFVVDTALRHSSPRRGDVTTSTPAADKGQSAASSDQPTISVAKPPDNPIANPADGAAKNAAAANSENSSSKAANAAASADKPADGDKDASASSDAESAAAKPTKSATSASAAKPAEPAKEDAEPAPSRESARPGARAVPVAPGAALLASGEKYLYGQGVERNCGQALVYMRSAADQGNAEAMSHLGALYATGECAPFDRAAAYSWFARALAAKHNPYVERNLDMLWRDMTPQERQRVTK